MLFISAVAEFNAGKERRIVLMTTISVILGAKMVPDRSFQRGRVKLLHLPALSRCMLGLLPGVSGDPTLDTGGSTVQCMRSWS